MTRKPKHDLHRIGITGLLLIAIILSGTGLLEKGIRAAGLNALSRANEEYLESSITRSLITFGILSAVKVGLAIVEGTEVGVGFGVQVGDVVQSAYDYVDIAWRTVLFSSTILIGTLYVLKMIALTDHLFLSLTLLLILALTLLKWYFPDRKKIRRFLRDVTVFFTILTVSVMILLPLCIQGGHFLSTKITAPSIEEAEAGLSQFKDDYFPEIKKEKEGFWANVSLTKERIKQITAFLTGKAQDLSLWVLKIMAGYIFDTIVFPLLLFVILFWFSRMTARYLFNVRRQQTLKEDLEEIVDKVYNRGKV